MTTDDLDGNRHALSRRAVLAGLSATGAAGAFAGGSTAAYLSDRDAVGNGFAAGSVDLELCWTPESEEPCELSPGSTVSVRFADLESGHSGGGSVTCGLADDSNPAWIWVRTNCPAEPCGIERAIEVTMWHGSDCDEAGTRWPLIGADGAPIDGVSLCEALTLLSDGIRLDGDHDAVGINPLGPDDPCCLGIDWSVSTDLCPGNYARVDLEFHAVQARHNEDPSSPWPSRDCLVDCTVECDDECVPASFVAFCLDERPIAMDAITHLSWTENTVTWQSSVDLDSVVLYYGPPTFETHAPADGFPAGQRHTITRGDEEGVPAGTTGQSPADPCPDTTQSEGCGVRYNFPESTTDEGSWDCVCGPPGPDRDCRGGTDD